MNNIVCYYLSTKKLFDEWVNEQVNVQALVYLCSHFLYNGSSFYNKHFCCLLQNVRYVISLLHFSHAELLDSLISFVSEGKDLESLAF